jgi:predicted Zn-dependent peptidase
VVHARFLDEHLEDALEVMADMTLKPVFAEVDLEREVVVEEINMYEDTPGELIADYLTEAIFDGHPLGKSVLGPIDVIGSVSLEQISAYHRSHYTLPNMVVAAAGNVEHSKLVELATTYLASGNQADSGSLAAQSAPPVKEIVPQNCFFEKDTQQYHVSFGGVGLARQDERRFALSILDSILGGSASSRLFQEVRDRRGLAYSIYSYASSYSDTGIIGVYFGCRGESVREASEIVTAQIRSIINDGVSDQELRRAQESAKGRLVLGMETTHNRMSRLGKLTVTNSEILDIDELIERIDAVTASDIRELAAEFYDPEKLVAVAIGPDPSLFQNALPALGAGRDLCIKTD